MKPVQIVLIAVALCAALTAGYIAMTAPKSTAPIIAQDPSVPVNVIPVKKVLVATADIPMGTVLSERTMSWEEWPETGVRDSFITQEHKPEAIEEYSKTVARTSFFAGEPIRDEKIVRTNSGYLSAILPAGKRAVAIQVSVETAAGGFILPNDHVDAIISYQSPETQKLITKTVLQNVRVLAVDQQIEEEGGDKTKIGSTATLELTAQQTEIMSAAVNLSRGRVTLALRSVEDAELADTATAQDLLNDTKRKKGTIRIIKYGQSSEETPKG